MRPALELLIDKVSVIWKLLPYFMSERTFDVIKRVLPTSRSIYVSHKFKYI
jgi:hypothetical protein